MTTTMANKDKQRSGKEHIVSYDGQVHGWHGIDVEAARKHYTFWDGIDAIVRAYAQIHPMEVQETVLKNKDAKQKAYSDFGAGETGVTRHTLSLPFSLMLYLEQYEPTLFTDKRTLHEFMRRYEGFRACRVV